MAWVAAPPLWAEGSGARPAVWDGGKELLTALDFAVFDMFIVETLRTGMPGQSCKFLGDR